MGKCFFVQKALSGASEKDWGNSKMISIAICDDEAVFAEALHALVDAGMKEFCTARIRWTKESFHMR